MIDEIQMPTKYPNVATFGGPRRDILFVTSASVAVDFNTATIGGAIPKPGGYLFMIQGAGINRGYPARKPIV